MAVTIFLPAVLARLSDGKRSVEVEAATVGEAVQQISAQHPQLSSRLTAPDGKPYAYVNFYLNDEDIGLREGFGTPVQDGDEITVIPAIAGG